MWRSSEVGSFILRWSSMSYLTHVLSASILTCGSQDVPCAHLEDWWDLPNLAGSIRPFPRVPLFGGGGGFGWRWGVVGLWWALPGGGCGLFCFFCRSYLFGGAQ